MLLLSRGSEERRGWISGLLKTVCRDKGLTVEAAGRSFHLKSEFRAQKRGGGVGLGSLEENVKARLKGYTGVFSHPCCF